MPLKTEVERLVTQAREHYLHGEETALLSEAGRLLRTDPLIRPHVIAVNHANDLIDVHECAALRQRQQGSEGYARSHDEFAAQARQLKYWHLDQLCHLVR